MNITDLLNNEDPINDTAMRQAYGQSLFQEGKYNEALTVFTDALSQRKCDKLGLLDNRAATHAKLRNLDAALKDGRHMIRLRKANARGYLRTGHVLQLKGKYEHALRLYEHALKSIDANDERRPLILFKQVQELFTKFNKALNPPRFDPLASLPTELVLMVLGHLDPTSLLKLYRVSKSWKSVVTSMSSAFEHLDFTRCKKLPSIKFIKQYIVRYASALRKVTFDRLPLAKIFEILPLLSRCPKIVDLSFTMFRMDPEEHDWILGKFPRLKRLETIFKLPPNHPEDEPVFEYHATLESLTVYMTSKGMLTVPRGSFRLTKLRYLELHIPQMMAVNPFFFDSSQCRRMPLLEEMKISGDDISTLEFHRPDTGLSKHPCLRILRLSSVFVNTTPMGLPRCLEELICNKAPISDVVSAAVERDSLLENLTNLKVLRFDPCVWGYTVDVLKTYFARTREPTLTSLALVGLDTKPEQLISFMEEGHLSSVTKLDLTSAFDVKDSVIETMIKTMPNLKWLNLSRTQVTGYTIKLLADGLKLETLIVHETWDRISKDAIQYGRSKGIRIPTPKQSH